MPGAAAAAAAAAAMNINVFLRVRPLPSDYSGGKTLTVMDEGSVALCAPAPEPGQRDYKGDALAVQGQVDLSEQDKYILTSIPSTSFVLPSPPLPTHPGLPKLDMRWHTYILIRV